MSDDDRPLSGIDSENPPEQCPICLGERFAQIIYGCPRLDEEGFRALNEGRIVFGELVLSEECPSWQCANCGHRGGSFQFHFAAPDELDDRDPT